MKSNDLLLLAGLGLGIAYLVSRSPDTSSVQSPQATPVFDPIPAGTTYGGVTIPQTITSPQQGVDFINKNVLGKVTQYQGASGSQVRVDYTSGKTTVTSKKGGKLVVNTTRYTPPARVNAPRHSPSKNAAAIARYRG